MTSDRLAFYAAEVCLYHRGLMGDPAECSCDPEVRIVHVDLGEPEPMGSDDGPPPLRWDSGPRQGG